MVRTGDEIREVGLKTRMNTNLVTGISMGSVGDEGLFGRSSLGWCGTASSSAGVSIDRD